MMLVLPTLRSPGVYLLENTATGKVYVGSTTRNLRARVQHHQLQLRRGLHRNPKLQNAWNKYGESAFTAKVLLQCAPEDCLFFEQRAIDTFGACGDGGYNLVPQAGNVLGMRHSEEAKRKIGEGNRGRPCTPEMRAAVSKAQRGKVLNQEQRDAVSRAQTGRSVPDSTCRKQAEASARHTHSEAAKAKISAASTGRTFTDGQRKKISAGVLDAYATTDLREKVRAASTGRKASAKARAALDWTGRSHTDESKKKIGEASAKRTHSPETRAKIAASLSGKKRGPYKKRIQVSGDSPTSHPNHDESTPLVLSQEE